MEISDLIHIGKLDIRKERGSEQRTLFLKVAEEFQYLLGHLGDVFLLFTDYRVRYAKILFTDLNTQKGKQTGRCVTFDDEDLLEELKSEKSVTICLDDDEIARIDDIVGYFDPTGMSVIWNSECVGTIKGFFYNGAHDVYELQMTDGKLVLIPDVEAFVIETNPEERFIRVKDLDQFLDL